MFKSTSTSTCYSCHKKCNELQASEQKWNEWIVIHYLILYIQGMIRIKCTGQNNFSMNHFKPPIFRDFFTPSHNQFECTFCFGPSTAKWQRRTCLWQWWGRPTSGLSWCCPWTVRGSLLWLHSLKEKKVRWANMVKRASSGLSFCLCYHLESWTEAAVWTGAKSLHRNQPRNKKKWPFLAWKWAVT